MFSDQPTILSTEPTNSLSASSPAGSKPPFKKIIFLGLAILVALILLAGGFWLVKKYLFPPAVPGITNNPPIEPATTTSGTSTAVLPLPSDPNNSTTTLATSSLSDLAIEYLSFADFYTAPDNKITAKLTDYQLPLNIKIDVMNYYDLSRKLNLDPGLSDLNNNGFATITNPWSKEAPDFYAVYDNLDKKQIPLLVTSDFIIYYYQSVLKRAFKDIEENVFYDNLWNINKDLFAAAKNRYEARLASIGNINDSVLEGERLEAAFFAVALELLKPAVNQIAPKESMDDKSRFTAIEADRFYFSIPPYLRDDVLKEVKLIRDGKGQVKSPVLLYPRDYTDFSVPTDYRLNAKLNNFYLTTKWLNSLFPLNYKGAACPACLLDREDWRINLIAASLISQDFSDLPDLKNKWARIYKVISFFKGLREDLNYVHYRDSLTALFGPDYKIEELFADQNASASNNLEKLRAKLLTYDFPPIQGAWDKNNPNFKNRLGFKTLAEFYWPNDYIFDHLVTPAVDTYLGTSTKANNITDCLISLAPRRCNGFAFDAVNLVYPIGTNPDWLENTNYSNYSRESGKLREQLEKDQLAHTTNYWTTLSVIKALLEPDKNSLPLFARSTSWQAKSLGTAASTWVNLQLPLEKFSINQIFTGQGFNNFSRWNENSYIEPNLNLLNELIANNSMLLKMFTALRLNEEVGLSTQGLQTATNNFLALKKVVIKELTGEALTQADNEILVNFTKQLKIEPASLKDKQLTLRSPKQKSSLKEDLSQLKLLVIIHQAGEDQVLSVGPIWNHQESQ